MSVIQNLLTRPYPIWLWWCAVGWLLWNDEKLGFSCSGLSRKPYPSLAAVGAMQIKRGLSCDNVAFSP